MNNYFSEEFSVVDVISILSFFIGYENLIENRQQSADNDVSKTNEKQANYLLSALSKRLDEQDKMLKQILEEIKNDSRGSICRNCKSSD